MFLFIGKVILKLSADLFQANGRTKRRFTDINPIVGFTASSYDMCASAIVTKKLIKTRPAVPLSHQVVLIPDSHFKGPHFKIFGIYLYHKLSQCGKMGPGRLKSAISVLNCIHVNYL